MASTEELENANARAAQHRETGPVALSARYDKRVHRVVICLSSGIEVGFRAHDAQGLEAGKPADLDIITISPSGLGLHFPKPDADLYLPALLEGALGSRAWTATKLRHKGQGARSPPERPSWRLRGDVCHLIMSCLPVADLENARSRLGRRSYSVPAP